MGLQEWKTRACCSDYRKHVARAMRIAEDALRVGKWVLSWSAGKDSTAMVHLVRSVDPDVPIMIQFDDCDWPETRPYAERVAMSQGWAFHAVEPDFSVFEAASKCKLGLDDICSRSHELTQDSFLRLLDAKRRALACDGTFLGLRADESHGRRVNARVRGATYTMRDGQSRCCPIVWWTVLDVFAYLVDHDVEINPCYFQNALRRPEEIRLSWALPTAAGVWQGDMEHIRRYYPQQFRRIKEVSPGVY